MNEHFQEMLTRLAEQDLKARFVAHPDACSACRKLNGRVFEPLEAPPIPVEGCLTPPCRCRYEGCDLRSTVESLVAAGIVAVKEERFQEARELLYQAIDLEERNEKAWLWLSGAVAAIEERIVCLENVLAINPDHEIAREGLKYLMAQRRDFGPGEVAARKIKVARDAIGHIKASQEKITALSGERPPMVVAPRAEEVPREHVAERPPVREPMKEERLPMRSVALAFLYIVLAILILILVLIAFTYAGVL